MRRFAIVLALTCASPIARADLTFPVPAGWIDLSPGAPEENFAALPPSARATLRAQKVHAFFADRADASEGFAPNLNVILVAKKPPRITEEKLDEAVAQLTEAMKQQLPSLRLVEKGIVTLGDVKMLRVVYDADNAGRELRQMTVVVPGTPQSGIVTYSALRTQFDAMRPAFDAHVLSIQGAREPGSLSWFDWGAALRAALVGGAIGALVGFVRKTFRKQPARAPRR